MFNEVLKFGSYIVDALVSYRQPCFVYIPPKAELRGGAWVVVDPRINSDHMEMYADPDCRGGVLEPTGTVEIKFREKALIEAAVRLDPVLKLLTNEDRTLAQEGIAIDAPRRQELKEKRDKRLQELLPVYKQVAVHFADLHDTAIRMKKKHAIKDIVVWEKSRYFFYWRLRRQLILFNLRTEIVRTSPSYTLSAAEQLIHRWAKESGHSVEGNIQFVSWTCQSIQEIRRRLAALRLQHIKGQTIEYCRESLPSVWEALTKADPSRTNLMEGTANVPFVTTERSLAALQRITNQQGGQ